MKFGKLKIVVGLLFFIALTAYPQAKMTLSILPIEGNISTKDKETLFGSVYENLKKSGFNVLDKAKVDEVISTIKGGKNNQASVDFDTLVKLGSEMKVSHLLVVSGDKWTDEQTDVSDVLNAMFDTAGSLATGSATKNLGGKQNKILVDKVRVSMKVVDIETSYVVASGMAQGLFKDGVNEISQKAINQVIANLAKVSSSKNKSALSLACLPVESDSKLISKDGMVAYISAIEGAFISRGDKVGDRTRLEAIIKEQAAQMKRDRVIDPAGDMLKFGEIMKISYFISVSVDSWVESRTSGLDVFKAVAGTGTAVLAGESAKDLGGEQSKNLIQKVRVTIKLLDIESSYILATGVAQGEIKDDPSKLSALAMKDLESSLKDIEKKKKTILANTFSVACLEPVGNMDKSSKSSYVSAVENSLVKAGYKVADRNRLNQVMEEIGRQRGRGSAISSSENALELGKIMKISHFVSVGTDQWEEERTSAMDVAKVGLSAGTAALASDTMSTGGGKESKDIVANVRLDLKIIDIVTGYIYSSSTVQGKLNQEPSVLSDRALKDMTAQIKKIDKLKNRPTFNMAVATGSGNMDNATKLAYATAVETILINTGYKVGDESSVANRIKEVSAQRKVSENTADVLRIENELKINYKVIVSVDTWDEQKISGLSMVKGITSIGVGLVAEKDTSTTAASSGEEEVSTTTVKKVKVSLKVLDLASGNTIFEGVSEGLLKDNPATLLNNVMKNASKEIDLYAKK